MLFNVLNSFEDVIFASSSLSCPEFRTESSVRTSSIGSGGNRMSSTGVLVSGARLSLLGSDHPSMW